MEERKEEKAVNNCIKRARYGRKSVSRTNIRVMGVESPGRGAFLTGWCLWGEAHDKTPTGAEKYGHLSKFIAQAMHAIVRSRRNGCDLSVAIVCNSSVRRRNGCGPLALFAHHEGCHKFTFLVAPGYKHTSSLAHGPRPPPRRLCAPMNTSRPHLCIPIRGFSAAWSIFRKFGID